MYRRNLDIFVAGGTGLLGGAAYVAHVPSAVQVILGVALFFAPGYLWSEAILSQRLPGIERAMVTVGMSLIFPILGGFLFYALGIPLFRSAWVGLLVVLTLLGVVAAAIQRLREDPRAAAPDPRDARTPGYGADRGQPPPKLKAPAMHAAVYGIAAVVALGSVAYSVKSANDQKQVATTELGMPPPKGDQAKTNLDVINHEGDVELYKLKLYQNKKVIRTWTFTLANGATWQKVIAYPTIKQMQDKGTSLVADLYKLPDTSSVYRMVNNGQYPRTTTKPKASASASASK
jgi:uncharacterized membrane protein